jgi:hypothetical protein
MDCCDTSGKVMTYSKVATFMKLHYNFHAAWVPSFPNLELIGSGCYRHTHSYYFARESQYKRWFTEWGVRKRTYATEKGVIVSVLGKRQRPGQSTSNVTLQQGNSDKHIDKKQLARYLKSEIQTYKTCKIAPGV